MTRLREGAGGAGAGVFINAHGMRWSEDWLGEAGALYRPELWKPAGGIPLAALRQIWVWPLALSGGEDVAPGIAATAAALTAAPNWVEIEDLLDHAGPFGPRETADDAATYAEFAYFSAPLQAALFRPAAKPGAAPALRVWRRTDVARLNAKIAGPEGGEFRADVVRCNLYVARSGAAALVVEADFGADPRLAWTGTPLTLANAQAFIDCARRAATPFFSPGDGAAQLVPVWFDWRTAAGEPIEWNDAAQPDRKPKRPFRPASLAEDAAFIRRGARGQRAVPVADHWRVLLQPLILAGFEPDGIDAAAWRPVGDERIPLLSFVSLTSPATRDAEPGSAQQVTAQRGDLYAVSRGDWMRLCFADSPGTLPLPYAPSVVAAFEQAACYDRFFPSEATDSAVRYLVSASHFAAIGAGPFFDGAVAGHVRRHYFQLALVAQLERAALLVAAGRIAAAVEADGAALAGRLVAIGRDLARFGCLAGTAGVSSQIMPGEVFALWRDALGLDRLAASVRGELDAAAKLIPPKEASASTAVREVAPAPKAEAPAKEMLAELKRTATLAVFAVAAAAAAGSALAVRVLTP